MIQNSIFNNIEKNFRLSPTHSVVINLVKATRHMTGAQLVDDIIAEKTFDRFRISLSKRCTSPTHYRRFKPTIAAIASVERSPDRRFHLHVLLQKPETLDDDFFENAIIETASNNPYVLKGPYSINIRRFSDMTHEHIENTISYNFKQLQHRYSNIII